jgi:hypothetical protein
MTRADAITLTKALFVGLLLGSLIAGGLGVNIILAAILIAIALFILIVAPRADVVYALVGVVIGVVIAFLVPNVRFTPGDLTAIALVFLVTWM